MIKDIFGVKQKRKMSVWNEIIKKKNNGITAYPSWLLNVRLLIQNRSLLIELQLK